MYDTYSRSLAHAHGSRRFTPGGLIQETTAPPRRRLATPVQTTMILASAEFPADLQAGKRDELPCGTPHPPTQELLRTPPRPRYRTGSQLLEPGASARRDSALRRDTDDPRS